MSITHLNPLSAVVAKQEAEIARLREALNMNKELLQQALDALLGYKPHSLTHAKEQEAAVIALRAAISQPVPSAKQDLKWCDHCGEGYAGFCRGKNAAQDCQMQPVPPAEQELITRLAVLHQYEEIAEHYAKCAISPEALSDWVADRMDMPSRAQLASELEQQNQQLRDQNTALDAACAVQEAEIMRLRAALVSIAEWHLPEVFDKKGHITSFELENGYNGARDYIRYAASEALKTTLKDPA